MQILFCFSTFFLSNLAAVNCGFFHCETNNVFFFLNLKVSPLCYNSLSNNILHPPFKIHRHVKRTWNQLRHCNGSSGTLINSEPYLNLIWDHKSNRFNQLPSSFHLAARAWWLKRKKVAKKTSFGLPAPQPPPHGPDWCLYPSSSSHRQTRCSSVMLWIKGKKKLWRKINFGAPVSALPLPPPFDHRNLMWLPTSVIIRWQQQKVL